MKIERNVIDSTEELTGCMQDAFAKMADKIESLEEELREKDSELDDLLHVEDKCGRLEHKNENLKKRVEELEAELKTLKEDTHADGDRLDTGSA